MRTQWELVEESKAQDGSCAILMKSRVIHGTVYAFKTAKPGEEYLFNNYYYDSNQAFNALESWEVSKGILPKEYNPELI